MKSEQQRIFPARLDSLTDAAAFIEGFCASQEVAYADALRLTLVFEELFTNTVTHGHHGDCEAPVRLRLQLAGEHVVVHYADRAPPFDPRPRLGATPSNPDADPIQRAPGGQGIQLLAQLASRIDYRFVDGENQLRLLLRRKG